MTTRKTNGIARLGLKGLIAATPSPMHEDGRLNLDRVGSIVEHLAASGVSGLYVAGTTGEGASLSCPERRELAEAFVRASAGSLPVIVQVGHNSLTESRRLAEHAQQVGADAISANSPSYFKPSSVANLIDSMAEIAAAAPELPFYYYHIPRMTGMEMDVVELIHRGREKIPTLVGLKYSDLKLFEYQECIEAAGQEMDVLWGCDEMLLGGLATGAAGGVGSTYNLAGPMYRRLIEAFDAGELAEARWLQLLSVKLVRVLLRYGQLLPSIKAVLKMIGLDCGPCRLPLAPLPSGADAKIRQDLEAIGFFDWALPTGGPCARGDSGRS